VTACEAMSLFDAVALSARIRAVLLSSTIPSLLCSLASARAVEAAAIRL